MKRVLTPILLLLCACAFGAQSLDQPQPYRSARASSYRVDGANRDSKTVPGGESFTVLEVSGAGRIVHTWFTLASADPDYLANTRIKMYWDGEAEPSVDAPFGDFHTLGHGRVAKVNSALVTVLARPELNLNLPNRNVGGFNTYFPMPFGKGAKIVIENRSRLPLRALYYQIDYQEWRAAPSPLRFHAKYHETAREEPKQGEGDFDQRNPDGVDNHLVLETKGRGHFIGMTLSADAQRAGWWEGDEMIWIDGGAKPKINGTGTEDYFGGAWGFRHQYTFPYHGVSYFEKVGWREPWQAGKFSMYRFHERDPIVFEKSIRVSIERGHNNSARDSFYSSVAYWYEQP